jgi:enoyl-CoA hydratase
MNDPLVKLTTEDGIAYVELNRPDVRNAQSKALLVELEQILAAVEADDDVRVVVLGGVGPDFSSGHDLKDAQQRLGFTVEERFDYEYRLYYSLCMRLLGLRQPTIARVQGHCIAAGFMIAAMADLMVCSDDAVFSDPVLHKLGAAGVEVLFHPWVMPVRVAKELLLTGRSMDAQEAFDLRLANKVVAREELDDVVTAMAMRIAAAPPFAAQMVKRSINRMQDIAGRGASLEAHFDTHMLTHFTQEWHQTVGERISDALKR